MATSHNAQYSALRQLLLDNQDVANTRYGILTEVERDALECLIEGGECRHISCAQGN